MPGKNLKIKNNYEVHNNILEGKNSLSRIFFLWISPFVDYGNYFPISADNVPILPDDQKPKVEFDRLYKNFKAERRR